MTARVDTAAVRARAEAATPGEWWPVRDEFANNEHRAIAVSTWVNKRTEPDLWIVEAPDGSSFIVGGERHARFLAAARTDVPLLCARVEALERAMRDMRGSILSVTEKLTRPGFAASITDTAGGLNDVVGAIDAALEGAT